MSLEAIFEKEICGKDLKIVLYENFQFEFQGKNHGTGLIELGWMKDIIITMEHALNYIIRRDYNIEQLGHLEGNQHKDNIYVYNQDGYPYRIGFYCCKEHFLLEFNIGNSYKVEFFRLLNRSNSSGTDNIHISNKCFLNISRILATVYKDMIEQKKREPERKKMLKSKVKKILEKLSNVFEELTFQEIASKAGHSSPQKLEEIPKIIEDLLLEGKINARIREDSLVFGKQIQEKTVEMLTDIKKDTESIKEHTLQLEQILGKTEDIEFYLKTRLASEYEKIKDIFQDYKQGELVIEELINKIGKKLGITVDLLINIKEDMELIKEYTLKLEAILEKTEDIEAYLMTHLATDYEKIKDTIEDYKKGKIQRKEMIKRIVIILGKKIGKIFIRVI